MTKKYNLRAFVADADKLSSLDKKKTRWIFEGFNRQYNYQFGWEFENINNCPTLDRLMEFSALCPNISCFFTILDKNNNDLIIYGLRHQDEKQTILKNSCERYPNYSDAHGALEDFIRKYTEEYNLTEVDCELDVYYCYFNKYKAIIYECVKNERDLNKS